MAVEESCAAFLREAIAVGAAGSGRTHPNPCVGAVVVQEGAIVGRGWHRGPGTPHAEVEALREAGERARRGDLFVSLEPCCTWGRTPPCTDALLASGIRRVFAAVEDPNPAVAGKGLRILREAGIETICPMLPEEAIALDFAYHLYYKKGRPLVHLKWAQTRDGCARAAGGPYLSGEEARTRVHEARFLADAILVTAGTAEEDDPLLTVRLGERSKPLVRVILDRKGDWEPRGRLAASCPEHGPLWVFRPKGSPPPRRESEGMFWLEADPDGAGGLAWESVLRELHTRRIMRLFVEGVGILAGKLLREGWVDLLSIHLVPALSGNPTPLQPEGAPFPISLCGAAWSRAGEDWVVEKELDGRCLLA